MNGISPYLRYEVNEITGCWLWTGYVNKDGYARLNGQNAHRLFYAHHVAAVPDELDVDHLCKRRNCVNPAHLEPVTELENLRRKAKHVTLDGERIRVCRDGHLIRGRNVRNKRGRNGTVYATCWLCTAPAPTGTRPPYQRRIHAEQDARRLPEG